MPVETYSAPVTPAATPPSAAPPASALASPPPKAAGSSSSNAAALPSETPKQDVGLTASVSGIIGDFQKLFSQQLALLRAELRSDWEKSKRAMAPMVVGGLCLAGAAIMLAMTGAYALHWSLAPEGTDPSRLPLWACFGIVGLVLAVVGGVMVMLGTWAFQSFNPLPDATATALEENIKALTDRKSAV